MTKYLDWTVPDMPQVPTEIPYRFSFYFRESKIMSEPSKERPVVPEGESRNVKTRQMKPNEKGFVGYETVWESFQKETTYKTPKKP